ncbi:MAG: hypothetical protein RLZZ127_2545 [Planctomycetota bacterium]|jgi:uncharacterized membrane protein YraQ (UPF0718 family)
MTPPGSRRWQADDLLIFALVATVVVALPPVLSRQPWHGDFAIKAAAMMIAALPYLVLGSILGGAIQAFVPAGFLPGLARRMGRFGIPGTALASMTIPVCECGSVAVTRGLLAKGLPLPHAVAFLLAGPVMNPTVLLSTWTAFADWRYPAARAAGALVVAILVAWVVSRTPGRWLRRDRDPAEADLPRLALSGATRTVAFTAVRPSLSAPHAAVTPHIAAMGPRMVPWRVWATTSLEHFLDMAGWYVFGCLIAAAFLVSIGQNGIDPAQWGMDPVLGPLSMSATAFILSVCAEADAFVAMAIGKGIAFPAIIAFLVSGPMLDIKLLLMYRTVFRGRAVAALAGLILLGTALVVAALTALDLPR